MNNLTRKRIDGSVEEVANLLRDKIVARGDLPHVTVEKQLSIVDQLLGFEFGRHMIFHQGAVDGYWNGYAILHNISPFPNLKPLERFMFERTPYMKAAFQTFRNMQKILQERLKEKSVFASIPSGVMVDLLTLDFKGVKDFELIGVDINLAENRNAQELAHEKGLTNHVHFYERDAWKLGLLNSCDGIVSHGLNFYEPNEEKQLALYRQFYDALKPNGFLLLSYLTPPPGVHHRSEWVIDKISLEDALLQRILYFDVLDCCWQTFHTTDQIRSMLRASGFEIEEIISDEARLIPFALAKK